MADIPLLGQNKPEPEENEEPQLIEAETAFVVFVTKDVNGLPRTLLTTDLNAPIVVDHEATMDEVLAAVSVVASDVNSDKAAVKAANLIVAHQQRQVQQLMQQQQNQQVLQSLNAVHK